MNDDPLAHFTDRQEAIQAFDNLWNNANHNWILAFDGFSGHGKTTLINWLIRNRCLANGIPYGLVGFENEACCTQYKALLDGLLEHEGLLKHIPREAWRAYRRACDEIMEKCQQQRASIQINMDMKDASGSQQDITLELAKAFRVIDRQARDRIGDAWLECVETIENPKIVFFLDTFERFQDSTEEDDRGWLWSTLQRAHARQPGLRVVVGSQEPLKSIERNLMQERLEPFTDYYSNELLLSLGVSDARYREAVFNKLAHGHPQVTRMAAEYWLTSDPNRRPAAGQIPQIAELKDAILWVHNRIIDRLKEPLKTALRWAALLRAFNIDILTATLPPDEDGQLRRLNADQFTQLTGYSFVSRNDGRWSCHRLVRQAQSSNLRQMQPEAYTIFHQRAADYFEKNNEKLEALYHRFFCEPAAAFAEWQKLEDFADDHYDRAGQTVLFDLVENSEIELELEAKQKGYILACRGNYYYYTSMNVPARERYEQALALYTAIGARRGEANCTRSLGDVHRMLNEYPAARERYEQALALYTAIGARLGEANCTRSLGDVHSELGQYQAARDNYQDAMVRFDLLGNQNSAADACGRLAQALAQMKAVDEAVEKCKEVIARYQALGDPGQLAWGYNSVGNVYAILKQFERAVSAYQEAVKLSPGNALLYRNLADSAIKAKQRVVAGQALDKAERLQPEHPYLPVRRAQLALVKENGSEALAQIDIALARPGTPVSLAHWVRALALLLLSRPIEANAAVENCIGATSDPHDFDDYLDEADQFISHHPDIGGMEALIALIKDAQTL